MVNSNAIVDIIKEITEKREAPCKKTLQKMVFLIENKKIDLGCEYRIHFYGPYSADLDFAVRELCDEGILSIEYTLAEHRITVINDSAIEKYSNDIVTATIDSFVNETPNELELLATTLYVYDELKNKEKTLAGVKRIKGTKFSESRINEAVKKLEKNGYLA